MIKRIYAKFTEEKNHVLLSDYMLAHTIFWNLIKKVSDTDLINFIFS